MLKGFKKYNSVNEKRNYPPLCLTLHSFIIIVKIHSRYIAIPFTIPVGGMTYAEKDQEP